MGSGKGTRENGDLAFEARIKHFPGFQIERREENVSIETVQTWNVRDCKVKEDNC